VKPRPLPHDPKLIYTEMRGVDCAGPLLIFVGLVVMFATFMLLVV
jgi:hypothetical protein